MAPVKNYLTDATLNTSYYDPVTGQKKSAKSGSHNQEGWAYQTEAERASQAAARAAAQDYASKQAQAKAYSAQQTAAQQAAVSANGGLGTGWGASGGYPGINPASYNVPAGAPSWAQQASQQVTGQQFGQDMRQAAGQGLGWLADTASGKSSAAMDAARLTGQQTQQAIASQAASAQGGRSNAALANAAIAAQARAGQTAAATGASAAAAERLAAQQAYLSGATGVRSQDVTQGLGLQQLGLGYTQAGISDKYQQAAAKQAYEQAALNRYLTEQGYDVTRRGQDLQTTSSIIGGVMSAAGSALGGASMSDRRAKDEIRGSSRDVDEILDKLKPYSYRYREEVKGHDGVTEGRHVGVMAQDLERTRLGKELVTEGDDGYKRVGAMATTTALALMARLGSRLARVERKVR